MPFWGGIPLGRVALGRLPPERSALGRLAPGRSAPDTYFVIFQAFLICFEIFLQDWGCVQPRPPMEEKKATRRVCVLT